MTHSYTASVLILALALAQVVWPKGVLGTSKLLLEPDDAQGPRAIAARVRPKVLKAQTKDKEEKMITCTHWYISIYLKEESSLIVSKREEAVGSESNSSNTRNKIYEIRQTLL